MVAVNNYEGMFLVDNRFANREWDDEEIALGEMLGKHGGEVLRGKRWAERKLAYEIQGHKRAVYYLVYFTMPPTNMSAFRRDVELSEHVFRNLVIAREEDEMQRLLEQEAADEAERSAAAAAASAAAAEDAESESSEEEETSEEEADGEATADADGEATEDEATEDEATEGDASDDEASDESSDDASESDESEDAKEGDA